MNKTALIKAAYFMCLALDQEPSVRTVCATIKKNLGRAIRWSEVALVLNEQKRATLGQQCGNSVGNSRSAQIPQNGQQNGQRSGNLRGRVVKELELEILETTSPSVPTRPKKQLSDEDVAVYALLDALKPHIVPLLGCAMTPQTWRGRNASAARDLVRAGMKPEAVLEAWRTCRTSSGQPFYMLDMLQRAMIAQKLPAAKSAPPWQRPDPYARLAAEAYARG